MCKRCKLKLLLSFLLILSMVPSALAVPEIYRSKDILYPIDQSGRISRLETAYVSLEYGYAYHQKNKCDAEIKILGLSKDDFVKITEYEALLRGYFECPDCSDDVKHSDVSSLYSIELSISGIESSLNDLIDFLVELFTGS